MGRGHTFARKNSIHQIWPFLRVSYLRGFDISPNLGLCLASYFNS